MGNGRIRFSALPLVLLSALGLLSQCPGNKKTLPVFSFQHPQILVKNVRSDYIILPQFDPAGNEIIFNGRLPGDAYDAIYSIAISGNQPRKLFGSNASALAPAFAPDRQKIVFCFGETSQICVLDIPTNALRRLPIYGTTPAFLPDNQTILYTSLANGNIYLYNYATGQQRTLTTSQATSYYSPRLHPDQARLIYLENLKRPFQQIGLLTLDSLRYLALRLFPKSLSSITLSPSGNWLIGNRPNGDPLVMSLADASLEAIHVELQPLTPHTKLLAHSVSWSPQGNNVVFVGNQVAPFSYATPYLHTGKYTGDIVVAELRWRNLDNAAVLQLPQVKRVEYFPPQPASTALAVAPKFTPQVINNPPRIISKPSTIAYTGELYVYQLESVEIDLQDNLMYTLLFGPPEAELMTRSGTLLWTPADTGTFDFGVRVQDSRFAEDYQNFTVQVVAQNKWNQASYRPKTEPKAATDFSAGLRFIDPDGDGFLSVGENAAIQISLKPFNSSLGDSVILVMTLSATIDEVEIKREVLFTDCQPGRWNVQTVALKGLPALRNRPIIIYGLLQTRQGLRRLPASLVINGKNPYTRGSEVPGTF